MDFVGVCAATALCFVPRAVLSLHCSTLSPEPPFFRMSLDSFFAKAETKDGDILLQAAQAVAKENQELRVARQNLQITQLRQLQANARVELAKATEQMVQIEKEMTAQKAVDQEAKLTQSTEILQACIDEMVETNPKVWAAIEGAPDASDAVYCSAPAAAEWTPPSWYHHEGGKGGFCKVCIAAGATTKSGAFVKVGSNNTDRKKKYGTKKHEQTLEHKHSVEALHRGIDMYAKMDRLGADVVLFMEKRFNEVYFLIKENLPLSKLAPLLELGIENGAYKDCGGESPLALSFFGFSYKHIHITTSLSLSLH